VHVVEVVVERCRIPGWKRLETAKNSACFFSSHKGLQKKGGQYEISFPIRLSFSFRFLFDL
jgi:hypothetical protein